MKKILTLIAFLMIGSFVFAQQFQQNKISIQNQNIHSEQIDTKSEKNLSERETMAAKGAIVYNNKQENTSWTKATASATYTAGHIPTDRGFTTAAGASTCPGELTVNIPVGAVITSVDVTYQMSAVNDGWMSEQRSQLRCVSPGGANEAALYSGVGGSIGTYTYNRPGLNIANAVTGGGDILFELHAGRTYGGAGCDTEGFNRVDDGTWTVTVHYFIPVPNDAGLTAITEPSNSNYMIDDVSDFIVTLRNFGTNNITNISIDYEIGSTTGTYNWTGDLAQDATEDVILVNNYIFDTAGNVNFSATIDWIDDESADNNSVAGSVFVIAPIIVELPYVEGFDIPAAPENWITEDNIGSGIVWNFPGQYAIANSDAAGSGTHVFTTLYSPIFVADPFLALNRPVLALEHYYRHLGSQYGSIKIKVDDGAWETIVTFNATVGSGTLAAPVYGSSIIDFGPWIATATSTFQLAFEFNDANGWNWYWMVNKLTIEDSYDVTFNILNQDAIPVPDATVTLAGVTNAEGDYVFEGLGSGTFNYSVTALGHYPTSGQLTVVDANITENVTINEEYSLPLPYATEFDGNLDWWTSESIVGGKDFVWTTVGGAYGGQHNSTTADNGYAMFDNLAGAGLGPNPAEAALVSPWLDFSGVSFAYLSFEHIARQLGVDFDPAFPNLIIKVEASIDDFNADIQEMWSFEFPNTAHMAISGKQLVDLNALVGETDVKVRFRYIGGGGYWWLIDDVKIYEPFQYDAEIQSFPVSNLQMKDDINLSATVINNGLLDATFDVVLNVFDSEAQIVETQTVTVTSLAFNDTFVVNFAQFGLPIGNYSSEVSIDWIDDQDPANNIKSGDFGVYKDILAHYDDNADFTAIGAGANTYSTAIMFTPLDMIDMGTFGSGLITHVRVFVNDLVSSHTLKIWEGVDAATEVYSQVFSPDVASWNIIELDTPFAIDDTQDLWIGVEYVGIASTFPAGIDEITDYNGKGNLIKIGANPWESLFDAAGLEGDWNIQVVVNMTACDAVSNGLADAITPSTAELSWTAGGNELSWNVEVGTPGFSPGQGEEVIRFTETLDNPLEIIGLLDDTAYEFYVQSVCDPLSFDEYSYWVGPFAFSTLAKYEATITLDATAITYGQSLADSDLSGSIAEFNSNPVDGVFSFVDDTTLPNAGIINADVTFTPNDLVNFAIVTGAIDVTVNQAIPVIDTWPTAIDITFGESIADSELIGGGADVPGLFTFDDDTVIPDAGIYFADVTFTPDDALNYESVGGVVEVLVHKAIATITISDLAYVYDDIAKSATITVDPIGLMYTVTYDGVADLPVNAGTYFVEVTIDDINYEGYNSDDLFIDLAPLSVIADSFSKTIGVEYIFLGTEFTVAGTLYGDDDVASVTLTSDGAEAAAVMGEYDIIPSDAVGPGVENYDITYVNGTLTVTDKITLTLVGMIADNKVYDNTNAATIFDFGTLTGVEIGHDVTLNTSAAVTTFNNRHVGVGKLVTVTGLTLDGVDAELYVINNQNTTANITARPLILSGFIADDKVYDGTTDVTGASFADDRIEGNVLEFTYNVEFADKTAAVDKNVLYTDITISAGADILNYELVSNEGLAMATIFQKELTVTDAVALNKVYDGSPIAEITGALLTGMIALDDVILENATAGTFPQAAAGTDLVVTTSMTISGLDAGNYTLTQPTLTADITPKPLIVLNAVALDKVYDGTTDAVIEGAELTVAEIVGDDDVVLADHATGTFAQAGIGADIAVTTAMTITGADADNYSVIQPVGLTADITVKELTIGGSFTVADKDFDGTTDATITNNSLTLVGIVGAEVVNLIDVVAEFANAGPAVDITVNITAADISGADVANYELSLVGAPTTMATINPLTYTLTLVVDPADAGTVTGDGEYEEGEEVTIVATAAEGYLFVKWIDEDEADVSTEATYVFDMPADDLTLTAVFAVEPGVFDPNFANISLYPNPSRGAFTITSDEVISEISVYNLIGKVVYTGSADSRIVELSLSGVEPGMYFVKITTEKGLSTIKLQINK